MVSARAPSPTSRYAYEPDLLKLAEWADILAIAARGDKTTEASSPPT